MQARGYDGWGPRAFALDGTASATIIGLLAARRIAYASFAELPRADRELFLTYLKVERIENAHPDL
jgi:hypothetical protein